MGEIILKPQFQCALQTKKETEFTSPASSVDAMIFLLAMLEFHLIQGT